MFPQRFDSFSTGNPQWRPIYWMRSSKTVLLGSFFVLASLAFASGVMALAFCVRVAKLLRRHSVRSLVELSTHVTEMQSSLESLSTTVRRMESKYRMRETRAAQKKPSDELSELQGDAWRQAARRKFIAAGRPVNHSEQ